MTKYSAADLARICRCQARLTTNEETVAVLLSMADRYDAEHDQAMQELDGTIRLSRLAER